MEKKWFNYERKYRPFLKWILVMKLTLFLLLTTLLHVSASVYSQQTKLSVSMRDVTVKEVLKQIEEQSEFFFLYKNVNIDVDRVVTVDIKEKSVENLLDQLFSGTTVSYEVVNRQIVLMDKAKENTFPERQQHKTVSGKVTDLSGASLPGVSVVVRGTTIGVVTDREGKFSLSNFPENASLQFSFVGMKAQEISIGGKTTINVTLAEETVGIEEVVAVGYGTIKKSDLTGAIVSVKSEQLNKIPTTSLAEMLRGSATGVKISMGNAAPGGSSSILIRGTRSLSGSNSPLFIVDGVPMSSIDDINSNDIASLEILKDASSQSIYGARAANGVILITTKRGESGKITISYNTYMASQNIDRNFEFYSGEEWAAYRKEAYTNANGVFNESDCFRGLMPAVLASKEFVNWEQVMIHPASQQSHDLLIQSGDSRTKYALSLGYYDQNGMVKKSSFQHLTGRLNIDHKLFKNLTIGSNISFTKSWRQTTDGSFNSFITTPPLAKIYNNDGSLREDVTEAGESHFNPLWNIENSNNKSFSERLMINLFADLNIGKGFSYKANASMSSRTANANTYLGIDHTTGKNTDGKATVSYGFDYDYLLENIFNYVKKINKNQNFDATLMQSINVIQSKSIGLNGTGFPGDVLTYNAISSSIDFGNPTWEITDRKILSYLGRARYNLYNRYLLTLAIRADGSSVFGNNNKYGFFPSAAFAWRMSEESFLKKVDWLSNLKLRLSYGQVGNQGISPYTTLGLTTKYLTEFGNKTAVGYLPDAVLWNPNLKWETSTSANIGLDFSLFKNRLSGTIETYDTQTTDLLVSKALSQTLGYSRQIVNLGQVQNRGLEFSMSIIPVETKNIKWEIYSTFSANSNKILKIDDTLDANGKPKDDINNAWFIGHSMNVYYDYVFDGIWQTSDDIAKSHMPTAPAGSIRLKDVDGDGKLTTEDRVIMDRDPNWIGSLGSSLKLKNIVISADIYTSQGGVMNNPYLTTFAAGGDLTGKRNGIKRNYWTKGNASNEAPAPNMNQAPAYISTIGYQDASYVRLRNVTLSYNFPKRLVEKINLSSLLIYTTLTNYWTKTKIQAYGPEQNPGDYPEPRTALIGLRVKF